MCQNKKKSSKKSNKKIIQQKWKKTNHFLQNKIAWENHSDEKKIEKMWISLNNQIQIPAQIQILKSWSKKVRDFYWNLTKWCFKIGLDGYIWRLQIWVSIQDLKNLKILMQILNCNQSKSGKVLFMYVLVKEKLLLKQEIKIGHFVSGLLIGIFKLFDLDYSKTEKSTNIINCMKKKNRFCCINAKKNITTYKWKYNSQFR